MGGLLHKLKAYGVVGPIKAYGVVGPILSILESILQECSLKVVFDCQSSPLHITNAGVTQGSVLWLTLFLVLLMIFPIRFYQE